MNFNCEYCPEQSNSSFPSIVISVIDEFNGMVYGKFCNYLCAQKDLNSYFDAAMGGNIENVIETQNTFNKSIQANKPEEASAIWNSKLADQESALWKSHVQHFIKNPNEFFNQDSSSYSYAALLSTAVISHWNEMNELWKMTEDRHERCALLLCWINSLNPSSKQINSSEDLIEANKNSWLKFANGYSFKSKDPNNENKETTVSYYEDKFCVSYVNNSEKTDTEIEENSVLFQQHLTVGV